MSPYIEEVLSRREAAIRDFLVIGRDSTARVQAEARWHLLDAVPLPIWSVTAVGEVAEVNTAWVTYTGLTREQTRGRGWVDVLLPDDITRARERWQRAQVTGESYEIEFRLRRAADGAYRWHLVRITPLRDASEQLVGWLATALDIDDRKRMEEERDRLLLEMHAARDWLQQVLDTLPEGILIANTAGQVVLVNRAAQEMLGGDLAGQRVPLADDAAGAASDVRRLDGSPYPATERPLQRALRQREAMHGDRHLVRRADSGQEIPVLMNSAPLCDASGTITGAIAVFQDISLLRDIERTQEEFLSSAAHDLKTPLTSIRLHAELAQHKLARLPEAASSLRHLEQIEAGTLRMARLIDELVDVTRTQMGEAL
ncbi:MAG TPA: PAS domain S-box protein [Chloroflexota bacterium]|nr:PAS domain S-box protein [Chloroflexota bacterium]